MSSPPLGSLSADLEDEWVYRRGLGDPGWADRSSYLGVLAHRLETVLEGRQATCFAVGADAERAEWAELLRSLHDRGHEIANHSYEHDLRLHRRPPAEIERDLARAADAIAEATGERPGGFRSPGYGSSRQLRAVLARQGYRYDASRLPSPSGPLARAWFGRHYPPRRLRARDVFEGVAELAAGVRPHRVRVEGRELVELPVTVMPYTRLPIHPSQLLLLARSSSRLALRYLELALGLCARHGIGPAVVIHPTDLLDGADAPALRGFPAMDVPAARKLDLVRKWLSVAEARFALGTLAAQAAAVPTTPRARTS